MLCVYNDFVRPVDNKLVTTFVLLNLSSAFDTVDHSMLLTVLDQHFGIGESAMDWFVLYLSDRTQTMYASGVMLRSIPVTCSILQGSQLGLVSVVAVFETDAETYVVLLKPCNAETLTLHAMISSFEMHPNIYYVKVNLTNYI